MRRGVGRHALPSSGCHVAVVSPEMASEICGPASSISPSPRTYSNFVCALVPVCIVCVFVFRSMIIYYVFMYVCVHVLCLCMCLFVCVQVLSFKIGCSPFTSFICHSIFFLPTSIRIPVVSTFCWNYFSRNVITPVLLCISMTCSFTEMCVMLVFQNPLRCFTLDGF